MAYSPYGNPLDTIAAEQAALNAAGLGIGGKKRKVITDRHMRDYPMSPEERAEVNRFVPASLAKPNGAGGQDVLKLQQFLRAQGYNLTLDGVIGPLTKSAILDWHSGVGRRNPQAWSRKNVKIDDTHRSNSGASANNQINQPADSPDTPYRKDDSQTAKGKRTTTNVNKLGGGLLSNNAINPRVLAQSMVDAKYGPILGELMRSEKSVRTQGSVNLTDIENWYGTLDENIEDRNAASSARDAANLAAMEGIAPSVATAFGLEPGSEAATTIAVQGDIGVDTARMINESSSDFANNLRSIAGIAGGNALNNERARQRQTLAEIAGQRRDLLAAKGSDFQGAYMDAIGAQSSLESEALKNQLAVFNAQMAMKMAPIQVQKAMADLQGSILGNQYTTTRINHILNPKPKPKAGTSRNFVDLGNEARYQLAGDITEGAQGLRQTLDPTKNNSKALVQFINNRLRMAGYKPGANRQVGQFAFDIARSLGIQASPKWWGLK